MRMVLLMATSFLVLIGVYQNCGRYDVKNELKAGSQSGGSYYADGTAAGGTTPDKFPNRVILDNGSTGGYYDIQGRLLEEVSYTKTMIGLSVNPWCTSGDGNWTQYRVAIKSAGFPELAGDFWETSSGLGCGETRPHVCFTLSYEDPPQTYFTQDYKGPDGSCVPLAVVPTPVPSPEGGDPVPNSRMYCNYSNYCLELDTAKNAVAQFKDSCERGDDTFAFGTCPTANAKSLCTQEQSTGLLKVYYYSAALASASEKSCTDNGGTYETF